jgi:hypothetical protein
MKTMRASRLVRRVLKSRNRSKVLEKSDDGESKQAGQACTEEQEQKQGVEKSDDGETQPSAKTQPALLGG